MLHLDNRRSSIFVFASTLIFTLAVTIILRGLPLTPPAARAASTNTEETHVLSVSRTDDKPDTYASHATFLSTFRPSQEIAYNLYGSHFSQGASIELYQLTQDQFLNVLVNQGSGLRRLYDRGQFTFLSQQDIAAGNGPNNAKVTFPADLANGYYYVNITQKADGLRQDLVFIKTNIAAMAREAEAHQLLFWTQNLITGSSVENGQVTIYSLQNEVRPLYTQQFDAQGTAYLPNNTLADLALIESAGEVTVIPLALSYLSNFPTANDLNAYTPNARQPQSWIAPAYPNKGYLFTDRPLYLPGDTVYFKMFVREDDHQVYHLPASKTYTVALCSGGSNYQDCLDGEAIVTTTRSLSATGAIDGELLLPADAEPGYYTLLIAPVGTTEIYYGVEYYISGLQVEFYRKPEYTIAATPTTQEVVRGESVPVTLTGSYFTGQPLAGQVIEYSFSDYSFEDSDGTVTLDDAGMGEFMIDTSGYASDGSTDRISVTAYFADSTGNMVQDAFNLTIHPSQAVVDRPPTTYQTRLTNTPQNATFQVQDRTTAAPIANTKVEVDIAYSYYTDETCHDSLYGDYWCGKRQEGALAGQTLNTDNEGQAVVTFTPPHSGSYSLTLYAYDQTGKYTAHYASYYVSDTAWSYGGSDYQRDSSLTLSLAADKEFYQLGETAQLQVGNSLPGNRDVLITAERGRVFRKQINRIGGNQTVIPLPIAAEDVPQTYLRVSGFTSESFETREVTASINSSGKLIEVDLQTDKSSYLPGESVELKVKATSEGQGVRTEMALWTIDKALFELTNEDDRDIFANFWAEDKYRAPYTSHSYQEIELYDNAAEMGGGCFTGSTQISLADGTTKPISEIKVGDQVLTRSDNAPASNNVGASEVTQVFVHQNNAGLLTINDFLHVTPEHLVYLNGRWQEAGNAQAGDQLVLASGDQLTITEIVWELDPQPVYNFTVANTHTYFAEGVWVHNQKGDARSVLKDTAYWNPSLMTNDQGEATVRFNVPDNLTTWIVRAITMNSQTQVGLGRSEFIVRRDIIASPILPDFLRVGDEIDLGMLVRNHTDTAQTLTPGINFEAGEIITLAPNQLTVPAHSSSEVRWRARVTTEAETTPIQLWVDGADETLSDNIITQLPVLPFGVWQKSGQSFVQSQDLSIDVPTDARSDKSSLTLTLSPSLISQIRSGLEYLIRYPYGCVEQTTSALAALLTVKENPEYFQDLEEYPKVDEYISAGLKHLFAMRQYDGGWGTWSSKDGSTVFHTHYVAEQLARAEALGIAIPQSSWKDDLGNALYRQLGANATADPAQVSRRQQVDNAKIYALHAAMLLADPVFDNYSASNVDFTQITGVEAINYALQVAQGWNDSALIKTLTDQLLAAGHEMSDGYYYWTRVSSEHYASDNSNTGLSIQTLMNHPQAATYQAIIDATVQDLARSKKSQYWSNTYGTARVGATILDYLRTRSPAITGQTYTVTLDGKTVVAQGTFNGLFDSRQVEIPLTNAQNQLHVSVTTSEPNGVIYWTLAQNWWRTTNELPARTNESLAIQKSYVSSTGKSGAPAVGDIVTVYLDLNNLTPNNLQDVVITDYVPSGWIVMNKNLKNYVQIEPNTSRTRYAHFSFYPERIEASLYSLQPGHNLISYQARVITKASATTLPTLAEVMYQPEIVTTGVMAKEIKLVANRPDWAFEVGEQKPLITLDDREGVHFNFNNWSIVCPWWGIFIVAGVIIGGTLMGLWWLKRNHPQLTPPLTSWLRKLLGKKVEDQPSEPTTKQPTETTPTKDQDDGNQNP